MQTSQLGVLREDPHEDMRLLVENYTGSFLLCSIVFISNDNVPTRHIYNAYIS